MANWRRARIIPIYSWPDVQPPLAFPDQEAYEVNRTVVLFGVTPLERSQETGLFARTIYRKAQRLERHGLSGLLEVEEQPDSKRLLPDVIHQATVGLKAEYSAFSPREFARICFTRFGRRPSPHMIKRVLAEEHVRSGSGATSAASSAPSPGTPRLEVPMRHVGPHPPPGSPRPTP